MSQELLTRAEDLRGYIQYLRDLGIFDLFALDDPSTDAAVVDWYARLQPTQASKLPRNADLSAQSGRRPAFGVTQATAARAKDTSPAASPFERSVQRLDGSAASRQARPSVPQITISPPVSVATASADAAPHDIFAEAVPSPVPFNQLAPLPAARVELADRPAALKALRHHIGDCTRCPLAYAGRHSIVFSDGNPAARLMFVGEGPGADEDETGVPFVGKAGQLLNNMIAAMGLQREAVYIANIVKCRPPKNRTPEPVEANTCSPFLLQQIDIVQPEVIVALGATAATYLLGVRQSLSSLRGQWFDVRGARCAVTYHPAYLLRDPRQKGEAWKDLQRVIAELKLKPPARA